MIDLREPAVPLYDYQKRWVNDDSRFKIWIKSRQIGASFASALEAVMDCMKHKTKWIVLSTGDRQSKEYINDKCKPHVRAAGLACEYLDIPIKINDRDYTSHEIRFPNGSRIIALPANPDTARGYTGNLVLDEFAFHKNPRGIWKAVFPTITRGKLKIRVISTYNGKSGMYYELANGGESELAWSRHSTDIYLAVEEGMPVDLDELKKGVNDSDTWQEEYECIPLDDAEQYIPSEMITNAESERASFDLPEDFNPRGDCYLGLDIGRKRDLTAMIITEQVEDLSVVRMLKRLRNTPFSVQRQELEDIMDMPWIRRACIDSTGLGAQLAEEAKDKYGEGRVEEVVFTQGSKEAMAVLLKRRFEDHLLRIPAERQLRMAIRAVKRYSTSTGHFRFDADRTEAGHADEFWALALAEQAGSSPGDTFVGAMPVGVSP
jgi:phage FluMu gp28-like protein